jgi:hypothetical protein
MARTKNQPMSSGRKTITNMGIYRNSITAHNRNGNSSNGNGNDSDQLVSSPEPQERPATAHGNRNHANPHKRGRTHTNTHTNTNDASEFSNDSKYHFMQAQGDSLAGDSQPSRSGYPIPSATEKELDRISSSNIGGGGTAGGARPRGNPRTGAGNGAGNGNRGRRERDNANAQANPLGHARQRQMQRTGLDVPKTKAPSSFMAQNNFVRQNVTASIGVSNSNSHDRRSQQNRHDDLTQKQESQSGARDMFSKAKKHNNEQGKSMNSLTQSIPRRKSASSIVVGASIFEKQQQKTTATTTTTTTGSKNGNVSKYFGALDTKKGSNSKNKRKNTNSNTDVVDLCDNEVVHVDVDVGVVVDKKTQTKPLSAASSSNSNRPRSSSLDSCKPAPKNTTHYGRIQIDDTSSPSEGEETQLPQLPQQNIEVEEPVSGSKEMAVFQSIANDDSQGLPDLQHDARPHSPLATTLEDHPGKAAAKRKSPLERAVGAAKSTASKLWNSVLPQPKVTAAGLTLKKRNNPGDSGCK